MGGHEEQVWKISCKRPKWRSHCVGTTGDWGRKI